MTIKQTEIKGTQWTVVYVLRRLADTGELCMASNDTCIMSRELSKLASDKSENLALHWIAHVCCSWTSILGQEIPGCTWGSLPMFTGSVTQSPTLCDVDMRCAWTSMICLHKQCLCLKHVSPRLIFCHRNSIFHRLSSLLDGIGNYAVTVILTCA
jgi:hypothetical protein